MLAQIQLPIGPVPFNLAVFGAFWRACLRACMGRAASMGVYMLLGAVESPCSRVLWAFCGALGKTGGYVIGYIFIALATALAVKRSGKLPVIGAAMLAGLLICYGFGTAWFMAVTGADLVSALGWCVLPFIVPDVCKGVLACVLGRLLAGRLAKAGVAWPCGKQNSKGAAYPVRICGSAFAPCAS
ncbi:MAG: biotin transporter BioY [Ruthenibacterium lactatiformans]